MIRALLLLIVLFPSLVYGRGFFDERYRGWFWFEQKELPHREDANRDKNMDLTPMEAKAEIEEFARELEELKFTMLARPTVENVKAYRDKEKEMWVHAEKLHDSWDMANLLYPSQRDLINNPVNVHAVKIKRELDIEESSEKIRNFAQRFDLVLFFNSSCKYCELLSPVLQNFAEKYRFNVEAVSGDGVKHQYFRTMKVDKLGTNNLVERLGITAFPTVIAVSHDGKTAFELIRGYVSISELEEYSLLAIKYLEGQALEKQGLDRDDEI